MKVIENGITRKQGYGFLFAIDSNCASILHHFRDKLVQNHDFLILPAFNVHVKGHSSEYCQNLWYGKTILSQKSMPLDV